MSGQWNVPRIIQDGATHTEPARPTSNCNLSDRTTAYIAFNSPVTL